MAVDPLAIKVGIGLVAALVVKGPMSVSAPSATAMHWMPVLGPYAIAANIPPMYAVKWIDIESGGNPCAVGKVDKTTRHILPSAIAADGHPKEMGIAQFYNPDDLTFLHLTSSELRAYCVPGTDKLARALTADELTVQAKATIALIQKCQRAALADLAKIGATWPERDVWTLVKLQHGLPGLSRSGLPGAKARIGRAPLSWAEYKAAILAGAHVDAGTEPYRSDFVRIFLNAEKCASVLP